MAVLISLSLIACNSAEGNVNEDNGVSRAGCACQRLRYCLCAKKGARERVLNVASSRVLDEAVI